MDVLFQSFSIYVIPPLLSLVLGMTLAVLSIAKGRLKQENVLFSLLCIWWSLLSPVFICHHVFRGDTELLLDIERFVHLFYVYLPPVTLLFFYKMTGTRSRVILPAAFVISFAVSLTTFTDYYFYGLYHYSWGYIAKGGIAFHVMSLVGSSMVVYLIIFFIRKLRTEKNHLLRLKLKYILLSYIIIGLLTMGNIPAINGIDFYPLGNMMFLPLAFLGYGVLSNRLMEIRSVLHITFMWAVISSLIIIPNALLFIMLYPYLIEQRSGPLFAIAAVWFYVNHLYLLKIQPLIDQLFNKRKYDLHRIEASFIDSISYLKTLDELVVLFLDVMKKSLSFRSVDLAVCPSGEFRVASVSTVDCELEPEIRGWFGRANHLVDRDVVESKEAYDEVRGGLLELFKRFGARYIVPVLYMGEPVALLALPEKQNLRQLKRYEVVFINNIRSAFSIAMENAITFSNLNMLKDNLEEIVVERTSELTQARDILVHDIELARRIQTALLPQGLPSMDRAEIHYKYVPMMGVGGDFIDILTPGREIGDEDGGSAVCFFICDVSGHGVSAALTAAMVKMSLASWEANAVHPARHLAAISDSLRGKTGGNFITAISCHVDLETGRLVFANAGHPPLIIIRADCSAEMVNTMGRLISDHIPGNCEDVGVQLYDQDIVVLYTDGIIEERSGDELFGEERFIGILKSRCHDPVAELCNGVYNALVEFKGNAMLDDDFTVLAMRYRKK